MHELGEVSGFVAVRVSASVDIENGPLRRLIVVRFWREGDHSVSAGLQWNQSGHRGLSPMFHFPETAMKTAKTILAGTAALAIISSAALAQESKQGTQQDSQQQIKQESQTGMITKIDRIHGTVAIQREQSGTVGANTGNSAEEFKTQHGLSLDDVHAGDKVTYSTTGLGGTRTITKLEKQKE